MEDADIKQQFHLLQKQVEAIAALQEKTKLDLVSQLDSLRIEVEVLKRFLMHHHSDFARYYPELKEAVTQAIDPEWLEKGGTHSA